MEPQGLGNINLNQSMVYDFKTGTYKPAIKNYSQFDIPTYDSQVQVPTTSLKTPEQVKVPENTTTQPGVWDKIMGYFKPEGESGKSTGGNLLSGIGTGVEIGSSLLAGYYARENDKRLQAAADRQNMLQDKKILAGEQMAKNIGNNASYSYGDVG